MECPCSAQRILDGKPKTASGPRVYSYVQIPHPKLLFSLKRRSLRRVGPIERLHELGVELQPNEKPANASPPQGARGRSALRRMALRDLVRDGSVRAYVSNC